VRLTASQKAQIRQAAALRAQTLSAFVLASATDAARRIIEEHTTIRLTAQEQAAFVASLLRPPAASARLERAAKSYRRALGLRGSDWEEL
jgi:uncharacterized protein (DUF1778 family)